MNRKQKKMLVRIVLAAAMVICLGLLPVQGLLRLALYLTTYLVIGYDILRKAGRGILNRQVFDENFLMAVATVGAFALAIYTRSGDYTEAIAVMLFYQIGELFQSYAVGKSRKNISALMDIRPDYANVERNGKLEQVDPDEVSIGSMIVVQPGEKVPLDGEVIEAGKPVTMVNLDSDAIERTITFTPTAVRPLLVPHILGGKLAIELPSIAEKKAYIAKQLTEETWESELRLECPHKHYVNMTPAVAECRSRMYAELHGGKV